MLFSRSFVRFAVIVAMSLLSAAGIAMRVASQSAPASPDASRAVPPPGSAQSGYVLKVTTRLVTLDLMATDSHGSPVRDLKPEELQIFEDRKTPQKIEHFEYFEKLKNTAAPEGAAAAVRKPAGVLSNQLPLEQLKIPPTVLLMDSLNTQNSNQLQGRAHMIQLLRTLPPDTPVAVFLLGSSLRILQGFTSDPALLQAALDQSISGNKIIEDPRDDSQGASTFIQNTTAGMGANQGLSVQLGEVQNFEKEEYAMTLDLRAKETLEALNQIGQYLSGIPGRKILIWVSESFPISMAPDPDTGNNPFAGIREYTDQVKTVASSLSDDQVAVYPMDVRGLAAQQSLSASQNVSRPEQEMTAPMIAGRLNREDTDLLATQGTMDELAEDTGGKSCKNSNDLSGCYDRFERQLFVLRNVVLSEECQLGRPVSQDFGEDHAAGGELTYRRGFYALDAPALAKKQPAENHLRQACADQLPSTTIPLTVQRLPSGLTGSPQRGLQYMLLISAAGLGAVQDAGSYGLNVRVADCEFAQQKTTIFRFHEAELPKTVSGEIFRGWQSSGIPYHVAMMPSEDTRRIRLVVLDVTSGLTGAIDIPVSPSELAKAAAPVEPPKPEVTTPYLELPDKVKGSSAPKVLASVTFHLGASASGTLDWSGDAVVYRPEGEMPLEQAANGFFGYAFGGRFHCQDGHFVPVDPADGAPELRFTFHNHSGKLVVVDLKGEQPVYVGDLPVDTTAQSLFEQMWKTSHCLAP